MAEQAPSGMGSTAGSMGELSDRGGGGFSQGQVNPVQGSAAFGPNSDRVSMPQGQESGPAK
jgi:hypothetical protein